MGIFRSTNPLDFNAVDGIVINESAPAPNVQGVGTGIVILVGQFERGPLTLNEVTSTADLYLQYGTGDLGGLTQLKNKKFSRLRIVRVDATGAALATKSFNATSTPIIRFDAAQGKGAYGNNITVAIAAGTSSGKKYTITDTTVGGVMVQEVYDNVAVASLATNNVFAASELIVATVLATSSEPDNAAATALTGGANGTAVDADYTAAIDKCAVEGAGNILILDAYTGTRNLYLKSHVAATQDKMVIIAGTAGNTRAQAVTDVASYRDTDGRIVYTYPTLGTVINNVEVQTSPAAWLASIMSQTAPSVDPASADNIQFTSGVTSMGNNTLTRNDYILLMQAGICAFEYDADLGGFKPKSGVVTQIANSSKLTITRRRMADYLTVSIAKFLKLYQNGLNSKSKRTAVKAAILAFIKQNEDAGILPKDSDVQSGKAKVVDTEVLNTDDSIAAGFFKILYRQRIFSSMRFIVLQAEIGESVVVTDQG